MRDKCFALIGEQQGSEQSMVYCVGEQLKEILRGLPESSAELVAIDLTMEGKKLADCEAQIEKYAKEHREGQKACVSPIVADGIIRKFYGLGTVDEARESKADNAVIDLASFL